MGTYVYLLKVAKMLTKVVLLFTNHRNDREVKDECTDPQETRAYSSVILIESVFFWLEVLNLRHLKHSHIIFIFLHLVCHLRH